MLGSDVSKATLTCTLLVARDQPPLWQRSVPNTPAASPWVVKTDRSLQPRGRRAGAVGRAVLLAQPKRAKSDRVDSDGLARYGLAADLPPDPLKSEAMDRLDPLRTARTGIAAVSAAAIVGREREQAALDTQIAARARQEPLAAMLDGVPGIGPVTAVAVASCLLGKTFGQSARFVTYIGLDVRVRDSEQRRGNGR